MALRPLDIDALFRTHGAVFSCLVRKFPSGVCSGRLLPPSSETLFPQASLHMKALEDVTPLDSWRRGLSLLLEKSQSPNFYRRPEQDPLIAYVGGLGHRIGIWRAPSEAMQMFEAVAENSLESLAVFPKPTAELQTCLAAFFCPYEKP